VAAAVITRAMTGAFDVATEATKERTQLGKFNGWARPMKIENDAILVARTETGEPEVEKNRRDRATTDDGDRETLGAEGESEHDRGEYVGRVLRVVKRVAKPHDRENREHAEGGREIVLQHHHHERHEGWHHHEHI